MKLIYAKTNKYAIAISIDNIILNLEFQILYIIWNSRVYPFGLNEQNNNDYKVFE